jgi:hypothetical protein
VRGRGTATVTSCHVPVSQNEGRRGGLGGAWSSSTQSVRINVFPRQRIHRRCEREGTGDTRHVPGQGESNREAKGRGMAMLHRVPEQGGSEKWKSVQSALTECVHGSGLCRKLMSVPWLDLKVALNLGV